MLLWGLLLFCSIPVVSLQDLKFTIEPKSVVVRKGSPVILNCQTNVQTSDIIIQWRKGYNTLWIHDYRNKRYQLLSNHSLYFASVGTDDEDVYFCGAYRTSTKNTIISKAPAHITLAYITTTFIASPLSNQIREHDTATLTCISGASVPLPSVTWEKNGHPITDQTIMAQHYLRDQNATSATLQLKNVSALVDTGYYRCVATNPLLPDEPKTSQQAFLKVLPKDDRPRIEVHPVNTISPRRHPVRLDCVILGNPPPVVFWLHDNVRVVNSSKRVVYANGSLVIHSLTLQDNGQYSCNGTNSKGTVASTDVFLNAAYIDFHFKRNPENQTAVNGSRVEIICEPPDHFPINAIQYSWYKAYRRISVNGRVRISSGNLVISPVLKSDEDVYFCEVSLPKTFLMKTRASTPAYLTVNVPPYFSIKPSDQTVVLRRTLRLSCKAAGFPQPSLTWYHGYALLRNTSRLTLGADGSLVLNMVDTNDAGKYKCEIQNVAGSSVAMATVTVHAPPNGTVMPSDTEVVLGDNANFLCRFAGNPAPVTIWYFKRTNERAVLLATNSSRYLQSDERLTVLSVTEADNGLFICVGENIVGVQNFSAALMVLVPARFEIFPLNTTVNASDVAEITCGGYGNPKPDVTWSMNGSIVRNDSRIAITEGKLTIRDARRTDTGIYSCIVKNYLRRLEYSVYLTVQVAPSIHEVRGPSRVQWKYNVTFSCKSDGVPTPQITWFKNSRKIPFTTRIYTRGSELNILSSENNDTGNYTCEASNVVGSIRMTRGLIVEVPPSEPLNLRFRDITSTSLQILWHSGFDGHSPITSFKLEIRRNSSHIWRNVSESIKSENFTVHGLKPYTVYHLRVFARNKIGWSESSRSVWTRTAVDAPSSPHNVQCQTISSSTVLLTWDKPSQPNGEIRMYRIQYSNHSNQADVSTPSSSDSISGLRPFTWYKFRVQAATGRNSELLWGNYSSYVICRSGETAPVVSPRNFTVVASGSHSIFAMWQTIPMGSENGIVVGYYIRYKKRTPLDISYTRIFLGGNSTLQYNIAGLAPWTEYVIQIAAMTVRMGPWSTSRTSRTMESVPSGPPLNVIVKAITSRSLSVDWDPPLSGSQNGIIRGYTVLYGVAGSAGVRWNLTTNQTRVELPELMIFTSYIVQVRAFTAVGFGPYSVGVVTRTLESYPSIVIGLSENITKNSVILTWQPPLTPNGIITAYTTFFNTTTVRVFRRAGTNITMYNVTSRSREITTNVTWVVLTGFYGNVTYSVCVAAGTSVGYGPCSRNLLFTTNFTKKIVRGKEEFTSSIIDDHLPLIASGAAVLFALLIALLACCFIRRRNQKKNEKETKQTFNFQRSSFQMRSFDDGESSYASRGSKPIHAYSVDSSSIHSYANPSNAFASPDGHDGSPLVRLRNNSLALGSDASSYDAPYSSVDEIGVDPTTVAPIYTTPYTPEGGPRKFVNALFTQRELEDTRGETGSLNSYTQSNPIYQPNYPRVPRRESGASPFENIEEDVGDYPLGEGPLDLGDYEVLVLPPPPQEYSDYGDDDEALRAYSNAVTDF